MGQTFYIATSLSNWRKHNELRDYLVERGHQISHDWTQASPWITERSDGIGGSEAHEHLEAVAKAGELDLEGIRRADFVVALLPGGNGTHAEIGGALILGKRVLIVGTEEQLFGSEHQYTCAFYHVENAVHINLDLCSWEDAKMVVSDHLEVLPPGPPMPYAIGFDSMARSAHDNAFRKGFWSNPQAHNEINVGETFMLMICELCEAYERWRAGEDVQVVDALAKSAYDRAIANQLESRPEEPSDCNIGEKLMLMVTELAEAYDEWHAGNDLTTITMDVDGKPGKPGGFPTELADIIIRLGDLAGRYDIPVDEAISRKMFYNLGRPFMHGKRC